MSPVALGVRAARGPFANRRPSRRKAHFRPRLQPLESRVVLSVVDLRAIGSSGAIDRAIDRHSMSAPGVHFGDQKLNTKYKKGSSSDGHEAGTAPAAGAHRSTTCTTIYNAATGRPIANPQPVGIRVKDSATVTGAHHKPAGTVTFLFYHNASGTGIPILAGTVKLNARGVASYSDVEGPLAPGSYSFVAHYYGDCCHRPSTSAPEPLFIQAAQPIVSTLQSPAHVTLKSTTPPVLTDSATLSGGYLPTGTLTFRLYAPNGTTVVDSETVAVSGNRTYATPSGYALPATGAVTGTYQWLASYSGDGYNRAASSTSGAEPVTVAPASPTISTTANPTDVTLDDNGSPTLNDSATLADSYNATGNLTFTLYARRHDGAGHRDGDGVRQRDVQHPDGLHAASQRYGDGNLQLGCQLHRRPQQQPREQQNGERAGHRQPGIARNQHDDRSDPGDGRNGAIQ